MAAYRMDRSRKDCRMTDATRTLNLLSGIYEEIARVAATHRRG